MPNWTMTKIYTLIDENLADEYMPLTGTLEQLERKLGVHLIPYEEDMKMKCIFDVYKGLYSWYTILNIQTQGVT